jgi:hypothetical protein
MVGVEEELAGRTDVIGHGFLEVWVCVHAEKVESGDEVIVSSIYVDSPCVNVTDRLAVQGCTADSVAGLLNVADQLLRLSAGARVVLDACRGNPV